MKMLRSIVKKINNALLTGGQAIGGDDVAHDGHHREVHDAGRPEEEAGQAVVEARGVAPQPVVVPRRHGGQRVHGDGRPQVDHGQIDAQHLGGLHAGGPPVGHDEHQDVAHDGEPGWGRGERKEGDKDRVRKEIDINHD